LISSFHQIDTEVFFPEFYRLEPFVPIIYPIMGGYTSPYQAEYILDSLYFYTGRKNIVAKGGVLTNGAVFQVLDNRRRHLRNGLPDGFDNKWFKIVFLTGVYYEVINIEAVAR
jgi:hypothetical protein